MVHRTALSRRAAANSLLVRLAALLLALAWMAGWLVAPAAAQTLPEGWQARADRPAMDMSQVVFEGMPPGWHVTTGPAVILWDEAMTASGDFRVEVEIHLFDPGARREAFGVFVGGRDLAGDAQAYTYFLLRNGGEFLVKERDGAETRDVIAWTAHPAVRSFADRGPDDASVLNVLRLERRGDELRFFVNDDEVGRVSAGALPLDGIVGLRVNHALNLHVSRLEIVGLD